MYLPGLPTVDFMSFLEQIVDWIQRRLVELMEFLLRFRILADIEDWLALMASIMQKCLHWLFVCPPLWITQAFVACVNLLHQHPHPIYILSWTIFFGPIIILLPLLLLHEILVSLVSNLSFILHGLLPGSAASNYARLRSSFLDSRERLFSTVDHMAVDYNTWTKECIPLLALRVLAGSLGVYVLYGLWGGWE